MLSLAEKLLKGKNSKKKLLGKLLPKLRELRKQRSIRKSVLLGSRREDSKLKRIQSPSGAMVKQRC
jgi:hypothetical protein